MYFLILTEALILLLYSHTEEILLAPYLYKIHYFYFIQRQKIIFSATKCNNSHYSFFKLVKVNIVRDKITWPGARMRKPNEGMPNYENNNVRGSLFITFDIDFPKGAFSDEAKEGKKLKMKVHLRS